MATTKLTPIITNNLVTGFTADGLSYSIEPTTPSAFDGYVEQWNKYKTITGEWIFFRGAGSAVSPSFNYDYTVTAPSLRTSYLTTIFAKKCYVPYTITSAGSTNGDLNNWDFKDPATNVTFIKDMLIGSGTLYMEVYDPVANTTQTTTGATYTKGSNTNFDVKIRANETINMTLHCFSGSFPNKLFLSVTSGSDINKPKDLVITSFIFDNDKNKQIFSNGGTTTSTTPTFPSPNTNVFNYELKNAQIATASQLSININTINFTTIKQRVLKGKLTEANFNNYTILADVWSDTQNSALENVNFGGYGTNYGNGGFGKYTKLAGDSNYNFYLLNGSTTNYLKEYDADFDVIAFRDANFKNTNNEVKMSQVGLKYTNSKIEFSSTLTPYDKMDGRVITMKIDKWTFTPYFMSMPQKDTSSNNLDYKISESANNWSDCRTKIQALANPTTTMRITFFSMKYDQSFLTELQIDKTLGTSKGFDLNIGPANEHIPAILSFNGTDRNIQIRLVIGGDIDEKVKVSPILKVYFPEILTGLIAVGV